MCSRTLLADIVDCVTEHEDDTRFVDQALAISYPLARGESVSFVISGSGFVENMKIDLNF